MGTLTVLGGCRAGEDTGPVVASSPGADAASDPATSTACRAFLASTPAAINGEAARTVSPSSALVRAWGDPAITLSCGVPPARDFAGGASCLKADGVDWYIPPDQVTDATAEVTVTSVGRTPRVELTMPAAYRPTGLAASLSELADAVKQHLTRTAQCR